jgi:Na+/citrate or Na+/malate symporter
MPYTFEQQEEYQRQFALRKRRQIVLSVPLIAIIIAALAFKDRTESAAFDLVGPLFFISIVGALIFSLWNWRCPACSKYLGKSLSPRFCPKCGVSLQPES